MSYTLAKHLQDAGFPFHHREGYCLVVGCWLKDGIGRKEDVHLPSLSELLAACGDDFASLERESDGTWITTAWRDNRESRYQASGETPEEAVALLWTSLNQK